MKSFLGLLLSLMLTVPCMVLLACEEKGAETQPTPTQVLTPSTRASPTAAATANADAPPELHSILSGKQRPDEVGVVAGEDGEELHVSLSAEGTIFRFQPGEPWTVTTVDGTVLSGTIVEEAEMWEGAIGFVRLDDGHFVAYSFDIDANWNVYPAEEMCPLAAYWAKQGGDSDVLKGFADVERICREKLGIAETTPEAP